MKVYKVGGAVRDRLLGRPVTDCDWVVVGAAPDDLLAKGFRRIGRNFPVFLHPQTREEYALARTERKVAPGYAGFSFDASAIVTLEDDLRRRDLTINAMAEDENGTLIDPFNGREDLRLGILRHVSPAFVEDPVRILRVARFAARFRFTVAPETLRLMRHMTASGEVDALVAERVWAETERALAEPATRLFFEILRSCGALRVIYPELDRLFGVPQTVTHHPEIDTGLHVMMVLDACVELHSDPQTRFAALVHDLGKGETPQDLLPRHLGHEKRSVELIDALCDRLRVPNQYRAIARLVARYHSRCHRAAELKPGTLLRTLEALDAFRKPGRFEQFLSACEADARGRKGRQNQPYPQAERFRLALAAAKAVPVEPIVARGLTGAAVKSELSRLRVEAIRAAFGITP